MGLTSGRRALGAVLLAASLTVPAVAAAVAAAAAAAPGAAAANQRWVMGYYVGYLRDAMPPAQVDWSAMTHVVVGPVTPNADGTLNTTLDIDTVRGPRLGRDLAARATEHGVTALLMIGGAGSHDAFLTAARDHRATFERALLRLAAQWGYAGLDLDWEPVDDADQPVLQRLITDLRAKQPNLVLTMPIGWVNPNYQTVPAFYATVASTLDRLNIMSYGMAGPWGGWKSWHSSALHSNSASTPSAIDTSVSMYTVAGVPAAKLGVGAGFYGSCWTSPVTGPSQAIGGSTIAADDNTMSYTNIMANYYSAANYHYDTAAEAPYLSYSTPHGAHNCTFVSYEDPTSIAAKGAWAQAHGLGAIIVWNVNEGHDKTAPAGQRDALLKTVRTSFGA